MGSTIKEQYLVDVIYEGTRDFRGIYNGWPWSKFKDELDKFSKELYVQV